MIERCRQLAAISDIADGTCRTFLSPATKRCYSVVAEWMKDAGMKVRVDSAGNLRGLRPGVDPGKKVLLIGSHLDTVRNAGAFDGILGVVIGIELVEKCPTTPFDIEVIGFSEEEGVRFGFPFIGSRALVGEIDHHTLERTDAGGISVSQAIRDFGLDPNAIADATLDTPALGFLEFHIEQGPVLDAANEPVGIVETIAGQTRACVTFRGSANHAGTTPMNLRRDALVAAAQWILAVERLALGIPGLVATTGKIEAFPGVGNVIAGEVTVSLDVRHASDAARERACADLRQAASQRGLEVSWADLLNQKSIPMNEQLTASLAVAAGELGCHSRRMVSGAGHDAMILAPHVPSAMLFLRSPGGVSHHPAESVLAEDVALALAIGERFLHSLTAAY